MKTELGAGHLSGKELLHILRHAIGYPKHMGTRNNYCVSLEDGGRLAECRALVDLGLMWEGRTINDERDQYFHVTTLGVKVAMNKEQT